MKRLLISLFAFLAAVLIAQAQIEVGIDLPRRVYLRGEAIEATVLIRNLAGRDITLRDTEAHPWFGFDVTRGADSPVPPHVGGYRNDPLTILAGETVKRTVDLTKLHPVNELASYEARATVYFTETGKYYTSTAAKIDVSEGRIAWQKTVGVPGGFGGAGELREMSLITFQTPKEKLLYARVEDEATGDILCTYPLGRIIGGATPMGEFDGENTLYAFHLTGQGQYALSKIGVNGEWMGQSLWISQTGRAAVRRKPDGTMVVAGATRERTTSTGGAPIPKLSDRPVKLPEPRQ